MISPPANIRRLVYLGTPAIAVPPLRAVVEAGFEVPLVVTNADKRRGRGNTLVPTPVKAAALELGLPVSHTVDDALDVDADVGVVVAFGRLIKPHVLDQLAMVNIHFSLLPRWRGAAPLERAILAGDPVTGSCLMALEETLDTGAVYRRVEVPIGPDDTLDELRSRLVDASSRLLVDGLTEGLVDPAPQEGEVTWAKKLHNDDFRLDWTRPAVELHRVVRLGRAFTTFRDRRFRIHRTRVSDTASSAAPGSVDGPHVATGDGVLELIEVQPEGKPAMPVGNWINGARLAPDDRLR